MTNAEVLAISIILLGTFLITIVALILVIALLIRTKTRPLTINAEDPVYATVSNSEPLYEELNALHGTNDGDDDRILVHFNEKIDPAIQSQC